MIALDPAGSWRRTDSIARFLPIRKEMLKSPARGEPMGCPRSKGMSARGRSIYARPFQIEREQAGEGVVGRNMLGPAVNGVTAWGERVMGALVIRSQ
jgi:hypothetical protein